MMKLGMYYLSDDLLGLDYIKALDWFKKAMDSGNEDAKTFYEATLQALNQQER